MENTSTALLRLDSGQNDNWCTNAGPVAILNPASTLHERIAYCWAVANDLQALSELLSLSREPDLSRMACLFLNQVKPLVEMLECLGTDTRMAEYLEAQKIGGAA